MMLSRNTAAFVVLTHKPSPQSSSVADRRFRSLFNMVLNELHFCENGFQWHLLLFHYLRPVSQHRRWQSRRLLFVPQNHKWMFKVV